VFKVNRCNASQSPPTVPPISFQLSVMKYNSGRVGLSAKLEIETPAGKVPIGV
jgi:hypothetical protein